MNNKIFWDDTELKVKSLPLFTDKKVKSFFSNVQQVFLYITDECNLFCKHCLYKPSLVLARKIPKTLAARLLSTFRDMGAYKLTFIGGEATLYGKDNNFIPLFALINHAQKIGFEYIRLDTNGHFNLNLLRSKEFLSINELSISIDGFNPDTNDSLRGKGSFDKTVFTLKKAQESGMHVHITSCVTRQNVDIAGSATVFIENMIKFAQQLKVEAINFHGVFKMGVPMDAWTEGSHITPEEWIGAYNEISSKILNNSYKIPVRLPMHIIDSKQFESNRKKYGYCPCKLGERVLIHPSGIIRICSSLLSTPYGVAKYDNEGIYWENITNELINHDFTKFTPCTNQTTINTEKYKPICFSFKPRQKEPVWERISKTDLLHRYLVK